MNDIKQASEILEEYSKPNSLIDSGNLFYAAAEYQKAFNELLEDSKKLAFATREFTKIYRRELKGSESGDKVLNALEDFREKWVDNDKA